MDQKISVIVPIYQVEKYLSKCIESIINQTYSNLEIILIDDGSPDRCFEICDKYASMDKRIVVIRKENGGLSDARNAGLAIATGEYISFIDSDDYIHLSFYEVLLGLILTNDADIAQCDFSELYDLDTNMVKVFDSTKEILILNNIECLNNLYNQNHARTVVVWNKIYRKDVLKGISFPVGKVHEDLLTTYKIFYRANKVVYTSEQMYYYVQRQDSIMGDIRKDRDFNVKSFDKLEAYYDQIIFFNENSLFKLSDKATERLEIHIRVSLNKIISSSLDNKDALFEYLVDYYKDKFWLFNNGPRNIKLKTIRIMFYISPKIVIKMICNVLSLKQVQL
ncbi:MULTISPECIES: glycosyltransferase [Paraliobacillus]|uniref:glycosyltransferase n=1 Tax=Paraliobacillus TaxID=200903 RepID=UPI000E3ECDDB|nr:MULTISPECIES: glycosyltransferase [Paraliobacillus]